jgi:hypothetical protein
MWAQVGNCVIFKAGKSICKRIYRTLGSKVMSYAAAEGEFLEEVRLPGFGAFIYKTKLGRFAVCENHDFWHKIDQAQPPTRLYIVTLDRESWYRRNICHSTEVGDCATMSGRNEDRLGFVFW